MHIVIRTIQLEHGVNPEEAIRKLSQFMEETLKLLFDDVQVTPEFRDRRIIIDTKENILVGGDIVKCVSGMYITIAPSPGPPSS